jgi:hypothetical protein
MRMGVTSMITWAESVAAAPTASARNTPSSMGLVSRISRWSVQSPPFSTAEGTPGSGVMEPKAPPPPANWNAVT